MDQASNELPRSNEDKVQDPPRQSGKRRKSRGGEQFNQSTSEPEYQRHNRHRSSGDSGTPGNPRQRDCRGGTHEILKLMPRNNERHSDYFYRMLEAYQSGEFGYRMTEDFDRDESQQLRKDLWGFFRQLRAHPQIKASGLQAIVEWIGGLLRARTKHADPFRTIFHCTRDNFEGELFCNMQNQRYDIGDDPFDRAIRLAETDFFPIDAKLVAERPRLYPTLLAIAGHLYDFQIAEDVQPEEVVIQLPLKRLSAALQVTTTCIMTCRQAAVKDGYLSPVGNYSYTEKKAQDFRLERSRLTESPTEEAKGVGAPEADDCDIPF
ncbi:MAG: hypothetical protein H7Z14_15280 [Anaerolineae bacterium]|nr:hypothetical protein [Phycisphaerae bacterium]